MFQAPGRVDGTVSRLVQFIGGLTTIELINHSLQAIALVSFDAVTAA